MLVVLLLLATGAGLAGWQLAVGQYTDTPALVGLPLEEATAEAEAAGLAVTVEGSEYSETVAEGEVISTTPDGGERILDQGTIELVVSLGKERYAVPDVAGLPVADARAELEQANLAVGEEKERYSGRFEAGQVINVSPDSGTLLKPDAEVDLTVSEGPAPVEIVDTTGETVRAATKQLEAAGLTVRTSREYDNDVAAGRVIAQDPAEGTGFKGDEVALVVSLGPEPVEVPNVVAQGIEAATAELEAAGFVVRERRADPYLGLGYVAEQDPAGGATAPFGSTITLYLV
jgi:serine/threonine-protein kinase